MTEKIISIVAALIRDTEGRVLLVHKRGRAAYMQPGGKRDAGENDIAALSREIVEELGCCVDPASLPDLPFVPLTSDHVLPLARSFPT